MIQFTKIVTSIGPSIVKVLTALASVLHISKAVNKLLPPPRSPISTEDIANRIMANQKISEHVTTPIVKCITETDKGYIVLDYIKGYPMARLAEKYACSRRTIGRILTERGYPPRNKQRIPK